MKIDLTAAEGTIVVGALKVMIESSKETAAEGDQDDKQIAALLVGILESAKEKILKLDGVSDQFPDFESDDDFLKIFGDVLNKM